jgi:hypothetical protein
LYAASIAGVLVTARFRELASLEQLIASRTRVELRRSLIKRVEELPEQSIVRATRNGHLRLRSSVVKEEAQILEALICRAEVHMRLGVKEDRAAL